MTEKKRYFTRNIALLLCLALILSLCPRTGASAESGNKIVLTTAEGTVIVKSASGKLQDAGEGAELSGGSTVITGPKSFVWLALDDTKAVKLDSNSEVEFRKRDKIYDIFIRSGRIFFTVPEKLADDETMRIYASSNAVTEIRGTDGWADTDSTGLLTGKIKLTITDPVTGKVVVKWVEAGQSLSGLEGARKTPEKVDLSYLKATLIRGDQMPAIVPEVLIEQPQICERAKQNLDRFGFDIDEMIASAAEKRAKEDAEAAKKAEQITDEIAKNQPETQEEKIPVFKEETVEDPGPAETTVIEPSGGGGYVPDPIPDTPTTCSLTLPESDYYYIESDDLTLSAEGDNTFYTAACGTTVTGRIGFITDICDVVNSAPSFTVGGVSVPLTRDESSEGVFTFSFTVPTASSAQMVVSGYVPFSTVSFTGAGVSVYNLGYSDDGESWQEPNSLEPDDTFFEKANVHNGAQVRFSCEIEENYTGTLQVFLGESQPLEEDAEHFYSFTADGDSVIRCTGLTASGSAIGFTSSFSSGVTSFAKKTKTEKANVTRAQAVTALWQLAGAPKLSCSLCFEDVSPDADYADAFRWAYRTGVLKNRTSAKPDKIATRQWIAKLFWNYSGKPDSESFTETFKDEKKISALSKTAARWALAKGLFAGIADNSRLSPKAGVTAAQLSTITDNYKSAAGKEPAKICTLGYLTSPAGLFITASGNILAADNQNNKVWKIAARKATVYAGADTPIDVDDTPVGGYKDGNAKDALFSGCFAITDFMGGFAVSDTDNGAVRLIKNGKVSYLTTDPAAPTGLTVDGAGRLYIADRDSGTISVLTTEGKISELISGLKEPMGLAYFNGYVYVAEAGANRVVSVSVETGARSVVAGSGEEGMTDGAAAAASFSAPMALAVTKAGDIYVADYANAAIRCIHLGEVTTVISDLDSDMIKSPTGLAILGNRLYVSDGYLHHIYAVMP